MPVTRHGKGLRAEAFARLYMRLKGYSILAERFRTPVGEIDLIAGKRRQIVFIEVKLRGTADEAAEAIHRKNRSRVSRAAELYLQKHPEYNGRELRFDVLAMAPYSWPRHIRNAW